MSQEFSSPPNATGIDVPDKTTGAAINTGTNDTDFATPKALADSTIRGYIIAATAVARLALTGLSVGTRVKQTDTGFIYILVDQTLIATDAGWVITYPAGMLSSTVVQTNVGTNQVIYTVPAGYRCIPTNVVARDASVDLGAMGDALVIYLEGNAITSFPGPIMAYLTNSSVNVPNPLIQANGYTGDAGDTIECLFNDTNITGTLVLDLFGYLLKA